MCSSEEEVIYVSIKSYLDYLYSCVIHSVWHEKFMHNHNLGKK